MEEDKELEHLTFYINEFYAIKNITMDLNLEIIVALGLVVFLLVFVVIKRNAKDKKELEQELNAKELKPDKHDDEHI
jgi:hypothetical protein